MLLGGGGGAWALKYNFWLVVVGLKKTMLDFVDSQGNVPY